MEEQITYPDDCLGKVFYFFGLDLSYLKRYNAVIILIHLQVLIFIIFIFGVILAIFKTLFKIMRTLWKYISNLYQFMDLLSMIASTIQIIYYSKQMIYSDFQRGETGQLTNIIQEANDLTFYIQIYFLTACLNILFTFIRVLQFFTFSQKLSFFTSVLEQAKYDITFFALMFSIVIFGYSVAGFGLFGSQVSQFSSLLDSILTLFRMLQGDFNYGEMYASDSILSGIFFVSFQIIFTLGLLNMFIAIIVAHYNSFMRELLSTKSHTSSKKNNEEALESFSDIIHSILKTNIFKKTLTTSRIPYLNTLLDKLQALFFTQKNTKVLEQIKQQIEAQQIQAILSERVSKPHFKDYQIHAGMKNYFQDIDEFIRNKRQEEEKKESSSEHDHNHQVMSNANIFRRIEVQKYESNSQNIELNNVNFWLYQLDSNVQRLTNNKVSLFDLQNDSICFNSHHEAVNQDSLTRFQKFFLTIDKYETGERLMFVEDIAKTTIQKLDVWRALDFEKALLLLNNHLEDDGFKVLRLVEGLKIKEDEKTPLKVIQFKALIQSNVFKYKFNKTSKFQHYLWTQKFTHEEKYYLWFEYFNALDRVKLWNRLVFSENYFNFVANTPKFKREDIRQVMNLIQSRSKLLFLIDLVSSSIKKKKQKMFDKFQQAPKSKSHPNYTFASDIKLEEKAERKIRDRFFTNKAMLYIWNLFKKRTFEVPGASKSEPAKEVTLSKLSYSEMLKSFFKLMVFGLSKKRIQRLRKQEKDGICKFDIYMKLASKEFDENEYRLALWLPLSLEEKLDMVMHQRNAEEAEIMVLLIEEEMEVLQELSNNEKLEVMLEKALNELIFQKYLLITRMQATSKSLSQCSLRLEEIHQEDQQLIEYAAFLHQKIKDYDNQILTQKIESENREQENQKSQRKINRLRAQSEERSISLSKMVKLGINKSMKSGMDRQKDSFSLARRSTFRQGSRQGSRQMRKQGSEQMNGQGTSESQVRSGEEGSSVVQNDEGSFKVKASLAEQFLGFDLVNQRKARGSYQLSELSSPNSKSFKSKSGRGRSWRSRKRREEEGAQKTERLSWGNILEVANDWNDNESEIEKVKK